MSIPVTFLSESLAAVWAVKRFLVKMDSEMVFQAAHFCKLVLTIFAFEDLVGSSGYIIVIIDLDVMVHSLVAFSSFLDIFTFGVNLELFLYWGLILENGYPFSIRAKTGWFKTGSMHFDLQWSRREFSFICFEITFWGWWTFRKNVLADPLFYTLNESFIQLLSFGSLHVCMHSLCQNRLRNGLRSLV